MKIESVRTAVIAGNFPWVLVKIETDQGVTGLGEAYWGAGVAELVHKAKPTADRPGPAQHQPHHRDPDPLHVGRRLAGGCHRHRDQRLEIALWDLVGRALGAPISTLFGGVYRDKMRIYADCHAGATPDPADYAKRAREVAGSGFSAIKFDLDTPKPYTIDISDDPHPRRRWYEPFNRAIGSREMAWMVDVVRAVRDAVGPEIMVAMDAHWKYGVNDAIKLAQALEPLRPALARGPGAAGEHRSPAPRHPQHAHADLHRREPVPQTRLSRADREAGGAHHRPRHPQDGGLSEAKKVADHADLYYIRWPPTTSRVRSAPWRVPRSAPP